MQMLVSFNGDGILALVFLEVAFSLQKATSTLKQCVLCDLILSNQEVAWSDSKDCSPAKHTPSIQTSTDGVRRR